MSNHDIECRDLTPWAYRICRTTRILLCEGRTQKTPILQTRSFERRRVSDERALLRGRFMWPHFHSSEGCGTNIHLFSIPVTDVRRVWRTDEHATRFRAVVDPNPKIPVRISDPDHLETLNRQCDNEHGESAPHSVMAPLEERGEYEHEDALRGSDIIVTSHLMEPDEVHEVFDQEAHHGP